MSSAEKWSHEPHLEDIISDYHKELMHGIKTKKLDFSKMHFSEDIRLIRLKNSCFGKKKVEAAIKEFVQSIKNIVLKRQYLDQNSSCTIWELITDKGNILAVELIIVEKGHIIEISSAHDLWKQA